MANQIVLTGIKPTGTPHLGNYLGVIKPALKLAEQPGTQALYFIADYHALTGVFDREEMDQLSYEVAATWLAAGLDPEKVVFYRQSDIPEIFELAWVLTCFTPKGLLNRAHAYKAKVAENQAAGKTDLDAGINGGVYGYPVLMAADILLFGTDVVPVGEDQIQHVEIARDIADRFNNTYKKAKGLKLPKFSIQEAVAAVPGIDGRKMSKSYGNIIPLFAKPDQIKSLVSKFKTDSSPPSEPKDPLKSHLFLIYREFATEAESEALAARFRNGIGWGEAKQELIKILTERLEKPRALYDQLLADRARVDAILAAGAKKARAIAAPLMEEIRKTIGVRSG